MLSCWRHVDWGQHDSRLSDERDFVAASSPERGVKRGLKVK
jgi:hypothetical protein